MWNYTAAYSASAGLTILPVVGILVAWVLILKHRRRISTVLSPPIRLARLFLLLTPPIYALGLILGTTALSLVAAETAGSGSPTAISAAVYLALTGDLLIIAAAIGITSALYLAALGSWYVVLGQTKRWRFLRLDTLIGAVILLIFDIALFGRTVALVSGSDSESRYDSRALFWLMLVIDLTLVVMTLIAGGTAAYVLGKLKGRNKALPQGVLGKIPAFILVASFLWAVRCCYDLAVVIRDRQQSGWSSQQEDNAQVIILPILEHWLGAIVLLLLSFVVRHNLWADGSVQPGGGTGGFGSLPDQTQQHGVANGGMNQYSQPAYQDPAMPAGGMGGYQNGTQMGHVYPPQYEGHHATTGNYRA
ncbi:hypothetical protein QBC37DRAFT_418520 [Rhypophila decipiens]|uniref:Uncharacterized protein n=1 Tax=Rhypophila decipiens TaxID=261697 RepID=A0AAN6YAL7_9PEZI|nr:hypothetical protein QBC37DRAFT_418520 [Rhypophila decipiens]